MQLCDGAVGSCAVVLVCDVLQYGGHIQLHHYTARAHAQLHHCMHLVEGLSLIGIPAMHESLDRLGDCHNYLFWPGTRPLIRHARRLSVVSTASTVSTGSAVSVVSVVSAVPKCSE